MDIRELCRKSFAAALSGLLIALSPGTSGLEAWADAVTPVAVSNGNPGVGSVGVAGSAAVSPAVQSVQLTLPLAPVGSPLGNPAVVPVQVLGKPWAPRAEGVANAAPRPFHDRPATIANRSFPNPIGPAPRVSVLPIAPGLTRKLLAIASVSDLISRQVPGEAPRIPDFWRPAVDLFDYHPYLPLGGTYERGRILIREDDGRQLFDNQRTGLRDAPRGDLTALLTIFRRGGIDGGEFPGGDRHPVRLVKPGKHAASPAEPGRPSLWSAASEGNAGPSGSIAAQPAAGRDIIDLMAPTSRAIAETGMPRAGRTLLQLAQDLAESLGLWSPVKLGRFKRGYRSRRAASAPIPDANYTKYYHAIAFVGRDPQEQLADLKSNPFWNLLWHDRNPPAPGVMAPVLRAIGQAGEGPLADKAAELLLRFTENPMWLHAYGPDIIQEILSKPGWARRREAGIVLEYLLALEKNYEWRGYNVDAIHAGLWERVIKNPAWVENRRYAGWLGRVLSRLSPLAGADYHAMLIGQAAATPGVSRNRAAAELIERSLFDIPPGLRPLAALGVPRTVRMSLGMYGASLVGGLIAETEWARTPYALRWFKRVMQARAITYDYGRRTLYDPAAVQEAMLPALQRADWADAAEARRLFERYHPDPTALAQADAAALRGWRGLVDAAAAGLRQALSEADSKAMFVLLAEPALTALQRRGWQGDGASLTPAEAGPFVSNLWGVLGRADLLSRGYPEFSTEIRRRLHRLSAASRAARSPRQLSAALEGILEEQRERLTRAGAPGPRTSALPTQR